MSDYRELEAEMREASKDMQEIAELGGTLWWTTCADAIADLRARLAKAESHVAALQEKIDADKSCACSYDTPDDVCAAHSPKLAKAERERDEARAELNRVYRSREKLDCRFAGKYAEFSGVHCPPDAPCQRCDHEAALTRARLEGRIEGMEESAEVAKEGSAAVIRRQLIARERAKLDETP